MEEEIRPFFSREPWPHQLRGAAKVIEALNTINGVTLCSATGAGKSDIMWAMIQYLASRGAKCLVLTNRTMLTRQTMENAQAKGLGVGVRAATLAQHFDSSQDIQISSIQTEISRTINSNRWEPFPADYVFVDEGHLQCRGESEKFIRSQMYNHAKVVALSATPVGMSHLYPKLIVSGSPSECLACGAHVLAAIKAPFEFDLSKVKRVKTGEYDVGDIKKHVWSQAIVGRVIDSYREENPEYRPSLVFAPCVETSISLHEDFNRAGIKACHIDATRVHIGDKSYADKTGSCRQDVLQRWKAGEIKVICNRFVLREGIDLPEMYHLMLATPMGSIKTYIQSTGRVIRKSPSTPDHVLITDFAGSYYKFGGGPNRDRNWEQYYYMTEAAIEKEIKEKAESSPKEDPITCPHCHTVRHPSLPSCPAPPVGCGREGRTRSKFIVQQSGQLKLVTGPNFRPPPEPRVVPEAQKRWDDLYYRSKNSKSKRPSNFNQLRERFRHVYGSYPPNNLLRMPKDEATWGRKVRDVAYTELRGPSDG